MLSTRALAAAVAALSFSWSARAVECPNCSLAFPSTWAAQEHPWGTRVTLDGQQVDVKVQPDDKLEPLGPGDVADELVWLEAEVGGESIELGEKNGRIVRTVSREPAVVLDYDWTSPEGSGKGVRLVRRCGVRLIFEQQGGAIRLDKLLEVSDRVRYTRSECTSLNADVIPLEVLESSERVQVPDVSDVVPQLSEPAEPAALEAAAAVQPSAASSPKPAVAAEEPGSLRSLGLLLAGLVGLVVLLGLMLRSGRGDSLEGIPTLDDPNLDDEQHPGHTGSFSRSTGSFSRLTGEHSRSTGSFSRLTGEHGRGTGSFSRLTGEHPRSTGSHAKGTGEHARTFGAFDGGGGAAAGDAPLGDPDPEHSSADDFGDENTDAILPAGTYGLRGAGGGEQAERAPAQEADDIDPSSADPEMALHAVSASPSAAPRENAEPADGPISVPSHAVVSYPSVPSPSAFPVSRDAPVQYEEEDVIRVSPIESVLASLGITTWLDFTAPGVSGVSYLPASLADLLAVQNGGRFGYGWLLLLGLRRKNMDLMTLNAEPRVKQRFGEGWLVGAFAFGNVLWLEPDQTWVLRTLDGGREVLGDSAEAALRRLADDPELRDRCAPQPAVERCRSAVGELLPGWVYRHHGEGGPSAEETTKDSAFEPVEIVPFLELLG
jgi:hypothetical protein